VFHQVDSKLSINDFIQRLNRYDQDISLKVKTVSDDHNALERKVNRIDNDVKTSIR